VVGLSKYRRGAWCVVSVRPHGATKFSEGIECDHSRIGQCGSVSRTNVDHAHLISLSKEAFSWLPPQKEFNPCGSWTGPMLVSMCRLLCVAASISQRTERILLRSPFYSSISGSSTKQTTCLFPSEASTLLSEKSSLTELSLDLEFVKSDLRGMNMV
jgi:hypothetical protein